MLLESVPKIDQSISTSETRGGGKCNPCSRARLRPLGRNLLRKAYKFPSSRLVGELSAIWREADGTEAWACSEVDNPCEAPRNFLSIEPQLREWLGGGKIICYSTKSEF